MNFKKKMMFRILLFSNVYNSIELPNIGAPIRTNPKWTTLLKYPKIKTKHKMNTIEYGAKEARERPKWMKGIII